jgi:hypothetical protein
MAFMSKNDFKIFNSLILCILLLGIASALKQVKVAPPRSHQAEVTSTPTPTLTPTPAPVRLSYIPEYVLVSFDGSRSVDIWRKIRELKASLKSENKSMNVTHFMNAAYYLTGEAENLYQAPGQERGKSNIGFSENFEQMKLRIGELNLAIADGDEIAVHTVGHFSGLHWSKEDWLQELNSFNSILLGLDKIYPGKDLPKINLKPSDIVGFRAPYLDHDQHLYEALHELPGYRYDSTEVAVHSDAWPTKDAHSLWHIPLGTMYRDGRNVLAMDYNWYAQDSKAVDSLVKGTPEWQADYDKTLAGLRAYFKQNYESTRAPVLVGYHFEGWNDGVYWEVLKTFVRETCGKPEVRCGTFKELVDYMEKNGVPAHKAEAITAAAENVVTDLATPELLEDEHNE